jgi:arylsulfatase
MSDREPFEGVVGRTYQESTPWWPAEPRPPKAQPNIVVIVFDDTGFAHFGCYGSTIDTPNIDKLARQGLRYTNFHTTALCSPTRAALLTGRNHHSVGMRAVSNYDSGFPHMRGYITNHAATLAEMLREQGYATFAVGKWHLAPMAQCSAAGPHDQWPLQRGFDRFYGFLQGETDQFYPELTYDNHHIEPPRSPAEGYHLSEDLIDQATGFIRDLKSVRPDRPYLLYLGFGATHSPHQAPKAFVEKYRGRFDAGWDVVREQWFARQKQLGVIPPNTELAPPNPGVRAWIDLSENQKKFALRLQEAFAGFLDHTDMQVGRLLDFLDQMGDTENTLVFLLSDNGASREGGPDGVMDEFRYFNNMPEDVDAIVERLDEIGTPHSHSNYPWGWAQAGNSPGKWYKQHTHGGGVRDPLIVRWPRRITANGEIRDQFHHVTDIVPTVLEELGVAPPSSLRGYEQMPIHGTSMSYSFAEAEAPTRKKAQYFEMYGHRAIWLDGWKAVSYHRKGQPYSDDEWELYHIDEDFSETRNLAQSRPEKLRELIERWWVEAGIHGVLPLDDRSTELFGGPPRAGTPHTGPVYTYFPPVSHVPADAAPRMGARPWQITAEIERPNADCDGVLVARGSHNIGLVFYIKNGHLVFDYNVFTTHYRAVSNAPLPAGTHAVTARFEPEGNTATLRLLLDGDEIGRGRADQVLRMLGSTGLDIGRDALSPVSDEYVAPFPFAGTIRTVRFEILPRSAAVEQAQRAAEHRAELVRE